MAVMRLTRRRPQWLRAAIAGLLLAFALNSLAHATHRHDDARPTAVLHAVACGYCVSFGGLVDAPRHGCSSRIAEYSPAPVSADIETPAARPFTTSARPRAPPLR